MGAIDLADPSKSSTFDTTMAGKAGIHPEQRSSADINFAWRAACTSGWSVLTGEGSGNCYSRVTRGFHPYELSAKNPDRCNYRQDSSRSDASGHVQPGQHGATQHAVSRVSASKEPDGRGENEWLSIVARLH
jgi:hypothetical protein